MALDLFLAGPNAKAFCCVVNALRSLDLCAVHSPQYTEFSFATGVSSTQALRRISPSGFATTFRLFPSVALVVGNGPPSFTKCARSSRKPCTATLRKASSEIPAKVSWPKPWHFLLPHKGMATGAGSRLSIAVFLAFAMRFNFIRRFLLTCVATAGRSWSVAGCSGPGSEVLAVWEPLRCSSKVGNVILAAMFALVCVATAGRSWSMAGCSGPG